MRGAMGAPAEIYHRIEQIFEEKDTGEKLFVLCVTNQSRGGYPAEKAEGYEADIHLNHEHSRPETELYSGV